MRPACLGKPKSLGYVNFDGALRDGLEQGGCTVEQITSRCSVGKERRSRNVK